MVTVLILALAATLAGVSGDHSPPEVGTIIDRTDDIRRLAVPASGRWTCVVFLRDGCPVAELQAATLAGLAGRFGSRGVGFLGVTIGTADDPAELVRFRAEHRWPFPIVADRGELAVRLGATRTPEAVVLDDRGAIRYRGRVDNRYAVGTRRAEATHHDLADALEDLVAGRAVRTPATEAVGCPIARPDPRAAEESGPTYSRDVAAILDRRCGACHRAGEVGPFPLTTCAEASSRASAIVEAVEAGRMPPWQADPRFGHFSNDARLTDPEKATLLAWIDAGCPEGDPAEIPQPIGRPEGWQIDSPDLVVAMPRPFAVPAQGVVDYQTFEVDPGFTADRWVRAAEIRPGNRRVVHHVTVFLKAPESRGEADMTGELGSYCLATTTPGSPPMTLPAGMAKRVPAGWRFVFVVHYAPVGSPQEDRTSLGLVFADPSSVRREVATNLLLAPDLRIPPHAADHRVERAHQFDRDVLLLALFPHMHLRGKSFRYDAVFPDGRVETLLDVPRYNFEWQNRYELAEPRLLPAGSTLRAIAHYDNSAANPNNPDPTASVPAGPQSWDEMFNGYFDIALADEDRTRPPSWLEAAGPVRAGSCLVVAVASASLLLGRRSSRLRAIATVLPSPS